PPTEAPVGQSAAVMALSGPEYSRVTDAKSPPMRARIAARLTTASIGQDGEGGGWNNGSRGAAASWLPTARRGQRGYMPASKAAARWRGRASLSAQAAPAPGAGQPSVCSRPRPPKYTR